MIKLAVTLFIVGLFGVCSGAPDCAQPPTVVDLDKCCSFKSDPDDEVEKKCAQLIKSEPTPPGISSDICMAECVFNNTQILTNGKLDLAKAKVALEKYKNAGPEFIPLMTTVLQTCEGKVNSFMAKLPAKGAEPPKCKAYSGALLMCISWEVIANCPAKEWESTPECNSLREYVKACPLIQ